MHQCTFITENYVLVYQKHAHFHDFFSQIYIIINFIFYFLFLHKFMLCEFYAILYYIKKMWKMETRRTRPSYQHNPHVIYWQISGLMLL